MAQSSELRQSDLNRRSYASAIYSSFSRLSYPTLTWWNFATLPLTLPPDKSSVHGDISSTDLPGSHEQSFIPRNPSVGLRLFTPLVPASDNKPALFLVSTFQLLMGLTLMTRRIPRIGESPFWARTGSITRILAGSGLIFLSGLEYARMMIPYDPWCEEAKKWRKWAIKRGYNPSWWFGAIWWYDPMLMEEWRERTSIWVDNTANAMETPQGSTNSSSILLSSIDLGPNQSLRMGESSTYHDIYSNLHQINRKRHRESLETSLADVNELNKAKRLDALMEGKGDVQLNEDYEKPYIQLGDQRIDTDADFENAWAVFDPWDELGLEVQHYIRLIPHWTEDGESEGET